MCYVEQDFVHCLQLRNHGVLPKVVDPVRLDPEHQFELTVADDPKRRNHPIRHPLCAPEGKPPIETRGLVIQVDVEGSHELRFGGRSGPGPETQLLEICIPRGFCIGGLDIKTRMAIRVIGKPLCLPAKRTAMRPIGIGRPRAAILFRRFDGPRVEERKGVTPVCSRIDQTGRKAPSVPSTMKIVPKASICALTSIVRGPSGTTSKSPPGAARFNRFGVASGCWLR